MNIMCIQKIVTGIHKTFKIKEKQRTLGLALLQTPSLKNIQLLGALLQKRAITLMHPLSNSRLGHTAKLHPWNSWINMSIAWKNVSSAPNHPSAPQHEPALIEYFNLNTTKSKNQMNQWAKQMPKETPSKVEHINGFMETRATSQQNLNLAEPQG